MAPAHALSSESLWARASSVSCGTATRLPACDAEHCDAKLCAANLDKQLRASISSSGALLPSAALWPASREPESMGALVALAP